MSDCPNPSAPPIAAYRRTLLETPARIVAENDKHVVIALRLRKKFIRHNHAFLAALLDATRRSLTMNENTNAIGVAAITELRKVIQDLHGLIEETNAIVQAIVASDMGFVWDTGLDD